MSIAWYGSVAIFCSGYEPRGARFPLCGVEKEQVVQAAGAKLAIRYRVADESPRVLGKKEDIDIHINIG